MKTKSTKRVQKSNSCDLAENHSFRIFYISEVVDSDPVKIVKSKRDEYAFIASIPNDKNHFGDKHFSDTNHIKPIY